VPLRSSSGRFAWRADVLALDGIDAELLGGEGNRPSTVPLGGASAGVWSLDVRDIDLHRIYAPLAATRLAGTIAADLDAARQTFRGNVAERAIAGGIGLEFDAVLANETLDVLRFRARAGAGALSGRGRIAVAGERAFAIEATAARFDPAHFGAFPQGTLDGTLAAAGVFAPAWRIRADVAIAAGSRLAGIPLSGTARGTVARDKLTDGAIDLRIGSGTFVATGSVGEPGDRLDAALDVPRLAEFLPLLPAAVPRTLAGTLNVKAQTHGLWPRGGIDIVAKGNALKLGPQLGFGTLSAHLEVAPAAGAGAEFASRSIRLDVDATDAIAPSGKFARARANVAGTLASTRSPSHSAAMTSTSRPGRTAACDVPGSDRRRPRGPAR
jgi:autotransporter translocation and assembly factor TamB